MGTDTPKSLGGMEIESARCAVRVRARGGGFLMNEFTRSTLSSITGGELFDYLAEKDVLMEEEAATFTRQILEGIACLHEKNIVHLDLKAGKR